ncbi:MAG: hypothetical protein ACNYPE_00690 [Candidatus Azotimanducaceae bacterium WSBS_2022_MAG_OTU7]
MAMFFAAYTIAADKTLNVADLLDFEKVTGRRYHQTAARFFIPGGGWINP